eukprot:m.453916 g.453916  ORF g.453916 m.453916 type:complete len:546 (-) comp20574_c0_seq1:2543-4180(-)
MSATPSAVADAPPATSEGVGLTSNGRFTVNEIDNAEEDGSIAKQTVPSSPVSNEGVAGATAAPGSVVIATSTPIAPRTGQIVTTDVRVPPTEIEMPPPAIVLTNEPSPTKKSGLSVSFDEPTAVGDTPSDAAALEEEEKVGRFTIANLNNSRVAREDSAHAPKSYQRSVTDSETAWDVAVRGPVLTFFVHDLVKLEDVPVQSRSRSNSMTAESDVAGPDVSLLSPSASAGLPCEGEAAVLVEADEHPEPLTCVSSEGTAAAQTLGIPDFETVERIGSFGRFEVTVASQSPDLKPTLPIGDAAPAILPVSLAADVNGAPAPDLNAAVEAAVPHFAPIEGPPPGVEWSDLLVRQYTELQQRQKEIMGQLHRIDAAVGMSMVQELEKQVDELGRDKLKLQWEKSALEASNAALQEQLRQAHITNIGLSELNARLSADLNASRQRHPGTQGQAMPFPVQQMHGAMPFGQQQMQHFGMGGQLGQAPGIGGLSATSGASGGAPPTGPAQPQAATPHYHNGIPAHSAAADNTKRIPSPKLQRAGNGHGTSTL